MDNIILGTVQFGLPYGISNNSGKPSKDEVFEILSYAYDTGIKLLDTASSYGDSEERIGEFIKETGKVFDICTKLPKVNDNSHLEAFVGNKISESLAKLNVVKIKYYFLHSFDDVKTNVPLLVILNKYKARGIIENIGISIYEPIELEYIINNLLKYISVVQIPFNILDNRWLENNLLISAKEKGLIIFSRSIYLQGLFFADDGKIESIHVDAVKYITAIKKIAKQKNIRVHQLLIDYVKIQKSIDYILIGCETLSQLKDNIDVINSNSILSEDESHRIISNFRGIPEKIIDPRRWN